MKWRTDETKKTKTTSQTRAPGRRNPASRKIRFAGGPYHDFWLFREGERAYNDYRDLLGRKDAPVRLPMDVVGVLSQALKAVPTILAWKNTTSFLGLKQIRPNGYQPRKRGGVRRGVQGGERMETRPRNADFYIGNIQHCRQFPTRKAVSLQSRP